MTSWECCRCGQVNAPHVSACTCKPSAPFRLLPPEPVPYRPFEPTVPLAPHPWWPVSPTATYSVAAQPLPGALGAIACALNTLGEHVWVGNTQPDASTLAMLAACCAGNGTFFTLNVGG